MSDDQKGKSKLSEDLKKLVLNEQRARKSQKRVSIQSDRMIMIREMKLMKKGDKGTWRDKCRSERRKMNINQSIVIEVCDTTECSLNSQGNPRTRLWQGLRGPSSRRLCQPHRGWGTTAWRRWKVLPSDKGPGPGTSGETEKRARTPDGVEEKGGGNSPECDGDNGRSVWWVAAHTILQVSTRHKHLQLPLRFQGTTKRCKHLEVKSREREWEIAKSENTLPKDAIRTLCRWRETMRRWCSPFQLQLFIASRNRLHFRHSWWIHSLHSSRRWLPNR